MRNEILAAAQHLIGAGITGLYQSAALVLLVWLGLRLFPRTNAATRHAVWFATLLMVVALFVVHALLVPRSVAPQAITTDEATLQPEPAGSQIQPLSDQNVSGEAWASANLGSVELPDEAGPPSPAADRSFSLRSLLNQLPNPSSLQLAITAKIPQVASLVLLGLWLAVAAAKIFSLVLQLIQIRRLKTRSAAPASELSSLFRNLQAQLGVKRQITLKISNQHHSPIVLGFLHPMILLPTADDLAEVEPVLRHELAHVGRFDDWLNLAQQFIQALFFFHPAVWWISRRLSLEREIACDDYVLQQCKGPRVYALLLADLAGRVQGSFPLLAPGASANKSQLQRRIDMILNTNRNRSPRLAKTRLGLLASAAALIGIITIYAAPRIVLAQATPPPAPPAIIPVAPEAPATPDLPPPSVTTVTPLPPDIAPGPKLKPGVPMAMTIQPRITVAPDIAVLPPTPPLVAVSPTPSALCVVPSISAVPPVAPRATMALSGPVIALAQAPMATVSTRESPARTKDMSIEERLARLERMVESLTAHQNARSGNFEYHLQPSAKDQATLEEFARSQADMARKQADMARHEAEMARRQWAQNGPTEKEIEDIKQNAKHQAEMAADQAKRANKEREIARTEARRDRDRMKEDRDRMKEDADGAHKDLDGLRKQHEQLQQEMRKIEREIRQIERDRKQVADPKPDDQPGADNQPSPKK